MRIVDGRGKYATLQHLTLCDPTAIAVVPIYMGQIQRQLWVST